MAEEVGGECCVGPGSSAVRLLIVDDHAGVRAGLSDLLSGEDDLTVVGECEEGSQAVTAAAGLRPDVVLMDLSMPGMDGLAATRALLDTQPDARVVILSASSRQGKAAVAAAGAKAFVPKDAGARALLRCLRSVASGCYCCPHCLSPQ